jgi:hypothetical protein
MMTCRHCRQSFEPRPDKKGFINECPECEGQRYKTIEAPSRPVIRPPRRILTSSEVATKKLRRWMRARERRRKKKANNRRRKAERRMREYEARARAKGGVARPVILTPTPKVVKPKPPETMTAAEWICKNNWSPYKRGN